MSTAEEVQKRVNEIESSIAEQRQRVDELAEKERSLLERYVAESTDAFDEAEISEMNMEMISGIAAALMDSDRFMPLGAASDDVAANASESAGPGKTVIQGSSVGSGLGDALREDHD